MLSKYIPIQFRQYSAVLSIASIARPSNVKCLVYFYNIAYIFCDISGSFGWICHFICCLYCGIHSISNTIRIVSHPFSTVFWYLMDISSHAIEAIDKTAEYWRNWIGMYFESTRISYDWILSRFGWLSYHGTPIFIHIQTHFDILFDIERIPKYLKSVLLYTRSTLICKTKSACDFNN